MSTQTITSPTNGHLTEDLVLAVESARTTYQFVGIEAGTMGALAAAINRWLVDHPGWAIKSVHHTSTAIVREGEGDWYYTALLEVWRP